MPLQVDSYLEALRKEVDLSTLEDASLSSYLEAWSHRGQRAGLSLKERSELIRALYAAIRGYGILDQWLEDPEVTEIMVNGYDRIFIEKNGQLYRCPQAFASEEKYKDLIQKIVHEAGREVHQRKPIVDLRMLDGSRVNVVLSPISGLGNSLTIRRFRKKIFSLDELVELDTLSVQAADFLKLCVRAKLNIFISGGTGSGKTTLLNALANEIPPDERLISIEDARELNFEERENWIALEARRANAQGEGEIRIRDLIRTALRMRPDRIIVGEVRGPEALDAIAAMNTGHDGSFCTGHANSVSDMQLRLETMILSGSDAIPLPAIRQQLASAVDLFVHVSRLRDHRRYVLSIEEPVYGPEGISYQTIFSRKVDSLHIGHLEGGEEKVLARDKFLRAGISLAEESYAKR